MSLILHIETSTEVCSVALSIDGVCICKKTASDEWSHVSTLMPLIDELMRESHKKKSEIVAVSASAGPGSYTGLRIGVSTAKGLCYALGVPLIELSSLLTIANGMKSKASIEAGDFIIPMIDARRMEVFAAVYNNNLREMLPASPRIMDKNSLNPFEKNNVFIGGSGANKLVKMYAELSNVFFVEGNMSQANFSCNLAFEKYKNNDFVNTAYFEPYYGKEYVPCKPNVKGLK